MNYKYEYYGDEAAFAVALGIVLVVFAVIGILGLAAYIMHSLSLHTIAKRRGLKNAWLSWIPVGQDWILGTVSDQYKYLTQGRNQSWRKVLLWLAAASAVLGAMTGVNSVVSSIQIALGESYMSDGQLASSMLMPAMGNMLLSLLSSVLSITAFVFRCMCKYDLYRSCEPRNAVLFLVLGIIIPITDPFFMLYCRNRDNGMPPRKPEPKWNPVPPVMEEPWENSTEE